MVSFEEYEKPEKINGVQRYLREVIEGKEYKRKGNSLTHQVVLGTLLTLLTDYAKPKGWQFYAGLGIRYDKSNFLVSDLAGFSPASQLVQEDKECVPDFIMEVMEPVTNRLDKFIKLNAYRMFGVHEYWVVAPASQSINVYTVDPIRLKLEISDVFVVLDEEDPEYVFCPEEDKKRIHTSVVSGFFANSKIATTDIFAGCEMDC